MLLVVHDSFEASSQNPTLVEEIAKANVWVNLLREIVPVDRLQECFQRAFRDKSDTYTVNAYDLKNAWFKIQAEEKSRDAEAAASIQAERSKVERCQFRDRHFIADESGEDEGLCEFQEGFDASTVHLMPCPYCRPQAFAQAQARRIEERAGAGVLNPADSCVAEVLAAMGNKPKIKLPVEPTAAEHLQIFYGMIIPEYEKAVGAGKDDLLKAAQTIVHAQDYVRDPARFYQAWLDREQSKQAAGSTVS